MNTFFISYKNLICLTLLMFAHGVVSQNETANWYFGDGAGLSFYQGNFNVLNDGAMVAPAGCSTISDSQGNLLFYTNGESVWNKNHEIMENGTDLAGDINHTQSSIIIPKPDDENIYYIFTVRNTSSNPPQFISGVYYSAVEISDLHPFGRVLNKNLILTQTTGEKITAYHDYQTQTTKVICLGASSSQTGSTYNTFYIYDVSEAGVNHTPTISVQEEVEISSVGAMKISPNGEYIAVVDYEGRTIPLFEFNFQNTTLNYLTFINPDLFGVPTNPYGIEFSPNSSIIYFTGKCPPVSYLYKYIINNTSLINDKIEIATSTSYDFGSLQLASDGKIYMANYLQNQPIESLNRISVINNPNDTIDNDFELLSIHLGSDSSFKGLPNFVQSYFENQIITENKCVDNIFSFSVNAYATVDAVFWEFGDGT
ncbi:MAG TPA: hypothetical protein VFF15_08595, partial [Flavobacteriaceae bacterium]|nr:hypothetical protein [Flavobacteriaceae bacterium]